MWPQEYKVEENNHFPCPADYSVANASPRVGLHHWKCIQRTHAQHGVLQDPQAFPAVILTLVYFELNLE